MSSDLYKNTNINENRLSDLDPGQVLKDSHNEVEHALDVNNINELVNVSYSKVESVYSGCQLTGIKYWGNGKQNRVSLEVPSVYELDISMLSGRYFILYDTANKKYCFYFKVDTVGVQPVVVSDFFVPVSIASTNTIREICALLSAVIASQSPFKSSYSDATVSVDWKKKGLTIGFVDGDTTFYLNKIQLGTNLEVVKEIEIVYDGSGNISTVEAF